MEDLKVACVLQEIQTRISQIQDRIITALANLCDKTVCRHIHIACSLKITSLFHTDTVPLDFIRTLYAVQYNKLILKMHCTSVEVMYNALPVEKPHISFVMILMCEALVPNFQSCYIETS
jgi:hypothetical protein